VTIRRARSLPLDASLMRTQMAGMDETEAMLSRREATLRSAAVTCLAGIAVVQAIELPSLLVQGRQLVVVSVVAMALCIGLGLALAAAPAGAAGQLWRAVAAAAVLMLASWAVPHAVAVPGLEGAHDDWASIPGAVCGVLAAVCLVLAVVAVRPGRAAARGLATGAAVLVALAPGVGALLVALGPAPVGGAQTLVAGGGHTHTHATPAAVEAAIEYQALPGGHGGRYVYRIPAPRHPTRVGLAIVVAAALVFTYGAVGCLHGRSAPVQPLVGSGLENGLA
jgi:hypothetical protein